MNALFSYAARRLLANILDTLILAIPASLVLLVLSSGVDANDNLIVPPASLLVIFLINIAYFTYFTSGKWQATPGKHALNLHVIRADRQHLTQRDALERYLAYILPFLPIHASFIPQPFGPMLMIWLCVFWFTPILFNTQRMGMHDKLCHTRVVNGRAK